MEYVYLNLDEEAKTVPRFKRSTYAPYCSLLVFGVFSLSTLLSRKFSFGDSSLDAQWTMVFYAFWPLAFLGVVAMAVIDFQRPSWTDSSHLCAIAAFSAGICWLLLLRLQGFFGLLLKAAAVSAMLVAEWRWWRLIDISQFGANVLFYMSRNVVSFLVGWSFVNLCFLFYAAGVCRFPCARAIFATLYCLMLLGGLAGGAGGVFASERIFGLKGSGGFVFAVLGAGFALFFA